MSDSIQAIRDFIRASGYTYTISDIFATYRKYYKKGYYCSYTANIVIGCNLHHFKVIDNCLRKKDR